MLGVLVVRRSKSSLVKLMLALFAPEMMLHVRGMKSVCGISLAASRTR